MRSFYQVIHKTGLKLKNLIFNSLFYDWTRGLLISLCPSKKVKRRVVKDFAAKYSLPTLIETGTYFGDMVSAVKNRFKRIYSIELDPVLYQRAKKRFAKFKHITLLQGDSAKVLPKVLADINSPCLFWLDAHYSGGITAKGNKETPIMNELNTILNHPVLDHVILIDDADCFTGKGDYPTLEELRRFALSKNPNLNFAVMLNIIQLYPKGS